MARLIEHLRSGDWLTRERMRLVACALLAASLLGLGFLFLTGAGLNDYQGRPLGTDFSSFYSAGTLARDGQPGVTYDLPAHHAREQAIFGADTPFYAFLYPPFFLMLAAALALLPYLPALAAWQSGTLLIYLLAMRRILGRWSADRLWILIALAFPAVFVNLGHGQNAFLSAGLLAFALTVLNRRPILAGILFGLLAYKPQLGLMIPIALAAGGYWRCIAAAAATVAAMFLASLILFGPETWQAFLASTSFTRSVMIEQGHLGWHKMQSVFAWVRMWGGPLPLAYMIQGMVTIVAGGTLALLWRSPVTFAFKAAALAIASILATPFSLDYDMVLLAVAIAFFAVHGLESGFEPYEKSALAFLWISPLIARSVAEAAMIPLGVIAMLLLFALILRRGASGFSVKTPGWISAHLPIK